MSDESMLIDGWELVVGLDVDRFDLQVGTPQAPELIERHVA